MARSSSSAHYVTIAEAAELAGVSVRTVREWKTRGLLVECSLTRSSRGQFVLLYDPVQVLQVERETRLADPTQRRARRDRGA